MSSGARSSWTDNEGGSRLPHNKDALVHLTQGRSPHEPLEALDAERKLPQCESVSFSIGIESDSESLESFPIDLERVSDQSGSFSNALERDSAASDSFSIAIESHSDGSVSSSIAVEGD